MHFPLRDPYPDFSQVDTMKDTALLVTVDVEEDMPGWKVQPEPSVRNIVALESLQQLCDEFDVPPTYLVSYPMAVSTDSARILTRLNKTGRCEIGGHLHPWNTPPLPNGLEREPLRATQIPRGLMQDKLATLTQAIEQTFGAAPRVFRFGRFGIDGPCLNALEALGYEVDSSITPGISWRSEGGPDFTDAPLRPYFPSRADPGRLGTSPILEVPVSAGFTVRIPTIAKKLYLHLPRWTRIRGLLSRDYADLLEYLWLSPWGHPAERLARVVDVLLEENVPVLNVFLHSSELVPGASGYARTEEEVSALLDTLRRLLDHAITRRGCRGRTLSQFRTMYLGGAPKTNP